MYQLFSCNPIIVQLSRTVILSRPHAVLINIHLELAFSFLLSIDARNDGSHFCLKLESRGIAVVPLLVVASRKICMPTNLTIYCTEITQKPAASIINMRRQKGSSNVVESSHINIRANYTSYRRLGFKPAENKKITEIPQKPAASIINTNDVESSHINIRANYTSYGRLVFKPAENKEVYMIFNDGHVTMAYHKLFQKLRYLTYN